MKKLTLAVAAFVALCIPMAGFAAEGDCCKKKNAECCKKGDCCKKSGKAAKEAKK